MDYHEEENFWIELKNNLLNFYKKDNKIYLAKYEEHKLIEERVIIDKCKILNSVILSKDENISLIYINLKGELFLSNFSDDTLDSSMVLTRSVSQNNYMQIASVNNSLNIFYINEVNTISTICFRILSNKLILTPTVIIDGIDTKREVPYIISASDNELAICYVKIGYPNCIGYRVYDIKRNSWSSFKELDKCNYPINNFDFVVKRDTIAYSYTFTTYRRANIVCGIGKENIENKNIQEAEPNVELSDIYISEDNMMYLIYLIGDVLKIKELEMNGEIKFIDDIKLNNINYYKKYSYSCDKDILKNSMLIIKSDYGDIYTDSNFIKNITIEKYKANINLPEFINNAVITDEDLNENIIKFNINDEMADKEYLKAFLSKIKGYEIIINNLTEKFIIADEEKKKLMENINYLNTQLNQKSYQINNLQNVLAQNKASVGEYRVKIDELTRSLNKKEEKVADPELIRLKEIVTKKEEEKSNYINIINEKDKNIKEISENKKVEISRLNNEILRLQEEYKKLNLEKSSYLNEINSLKSNIEVLNDIIDDNNNEINSLKQEVAFLEDKSNNDSFIKKLFKTGE